MHKHFLTILFIIIGIFGCQSEKVDFLFVEKIDLEEGFEYPTKVINTKEQLIHIFSQEHKPLYKFKDYIDFDRYDFNSFDYVLVFGKELIKLTTTTDECDHLSKIPLNSRYKTASLNNYLFVYKVKLKNKFRHLCP